MITIRRSDERGHFDHGWLNTYHTFSFAGYHDPEQMGFRALRVMNEDRVQPGQGFGMHPHRDMEIISYVLDGALEHRDSMGNGSVLRAGMFQRMSAGRGVLHSEFNHSTTEPVHLYQIWILPNAKGVAPSYEEKSFANEEKRGRLRLVASRDGGDGAMTIHQDAAVYVTSLEDQQQLDYALNDGRHAWLQVVRGQVALNGHSLSAGDGAAIRDETALTIRSSGASEVLLFDLS